MNLASEFENSTTTQLIRKYSFPAIMSGLVASIYNIVDQIFIGNIVGTEGNAATNVAFPLVTLTTALMLLIGLGGTINFSISLGQKNMVHAKKSVGMVLLVTPIVGLTLSLITLLFTEKLLWTFGATEENFAYAYTYVRITALGFPFWMSSEAATKVIRSDGAPKYAMICSLVGAILNCFLNPLYMSVFKMGIAGAAWATVTGQVVSFLLAFSYFFRFRTFKIVFSEVVPDAFILKRTMIVGASHFLNQIVMMLAQIVMNNVFAHYGEQSIYGSEIPLACAGIITKVTAMYMAVMIGIAQGAQPLLGFAYGAGKKQKVLDIYFQCIKLATSISVVVFLIFQIFPYIILQWFGADDPLYFEFGVMYFRTFMMMTFLNGIQPVTFNFFSAIGKPMKSTIISLCKQIVFVIPLVIILPVFFGVEGALYAGPLADVLTFLITSTLVRGEIAKIKAEI